MDYKREGHVWGIRSLRSFSLVDKEWNGGGGGGGGGGGLLLVNQSFSVV